MESGLRLGFFIVIFLGLALWERGTPKRVLSQPLSRRWAINFGMIVLNTLLTRAAFGLTLFAVGLFGQDHDWGLMRWLGAPWFVQWIAGILILDFAVWFQHWLFHRVRWLWPIHRVHHTDLDFDVSTGIRFHPAEIIPSMFYKAGVVLLFGIDPWPALVFEIILNGFSQFTHANINLPLRFEKIFRWIFVTPDMHRIHHSVRPEEHNRNFGFSFSWWDRIFRTYRFRPLDPPETMEIGIREFRNQEKLKFQYLLVQPFRRPTNSS